MKIPSISLKRTLDVTMKDTFGRIKELGEKDSQALIEVYKEWIKASDAGKKKTPSCPIYESDKTKKLTIIKKGLKLPLDNHLTIRI